MKNKNLLSSLIVAMLMVFGMTAKSQTLPISQLPDGVGKQIVSIHSYSDRTKNEEGPSNLLHAEQSGDHDKWCDNKTEQPWVIFELVDYYDIEKIVIRDTRVREKSNGNIADYNIYVTTVEYDPNKVDPLTLLPVGWYDSEWELVAERTDEGLVDVKTVELATAKEARYIKFEVKDRGTRYDNGDPENAVRIYGFDIYGTLAEKIDRGNVVSAGKTILAYYKAVNKRERPGNLLDGNFTNVDSKWCFEKLDASEPYPYVIIDLEKQYDITRFKVYDCKTLDTENNFGACDIYVSETAPDLSLISVLEDKNTTWKHVVNSDGVEDQSDIDIKDYTLPTMQKGRFVKLVIPQERIATDKATRIYQFEVLGTESAIPTTDASLALLKVSEAGLTPIFSPEVTTYSINVVKEIESITVDASANSSKATVAGAGAHPLMIGSNVIKVNVTAENGTAKKEYTINVNRADKSVVTALDTLYIPGAYMATKFNADSLVYNVDVRYGVNSIDLTALPVQAGATVVGAGTHSLTANPTELTVSVTAEDGIAKRDYKLNIYKNPENLISVNFGDPLGKRIVEVLASSGQANGEESASKLLIGERQNTSGNLSNKWCGTINSDVSDNPWVILSLNDIYTIEKIVIRDGSLMEDAANMSGYSIEFSTTGLEDEDWETVGYDDAGGLGDEIVVTEVEDLDARYIRFTPFKSADNGLVRIYGFDIYGSLSEKIDRENLVSVGKTIVDYSSFASHRESPHKLIDGNIDYAYSSLSTWDMATMKSEPWAVDPKKGDAYVIIDLEEEYNNIKEFKVYDQGDWIKGYKVFLSSNGNDWTEAFSGTFDAEKVQKEENGQLVVDEETGEPVMEIVGPTVKTGTLETVKSGRYVKLELPLEMQTEGAWNRIREFEVYTGAYNSINENKVKAEKLAIYPNPVVKGEDVFVNEEGELKIYTLAGNLVYADTISGATNISTGNFARGIYIVELSNTQGIQQAKLIVE